MDEVLAESVDFIYEQLGFEVNWIKLHRNNIKDYKDVFKSYFKILYSLNTVLDKFIIFFRLITKPFKKIEKDNLNSWILVDYFDVVVHIFLEDARRYYNLEHLWKKAKKIKIKYDISQEG